MGTASRRGDRTQRWRTDIVRRADNFLSQHLAGYKLPRQMVILPELPLTASGKIHRRAIAELLNSLDNDSV